MRGSVPLVLTALLLGCPEPEPARCLPVQPEAPTVNGPRFPVVGSTAQLELVLPASQQCTAGLPPATGVELEVVDPEGLAVAATAGTVSASASRGYAVQVRFPVAKAGPYFVRARFEPSLGVVQTSVEAAVDRTATPWEKAPEGWDTCEGVVGLRDGALGCRRSGGLELLRGGVAGERLSGEVREGEAGLWSLASGVLRLWEARDGGLAVKSQLRLPGGSNTALFDALGDEVLVSGRLLKVRARDGGLELQRLDDGGVTDNDFAGVLGAVFSTDGGLRLATQSRVCEVSAPAPPRPPQATCQFLFPLTPLSSSETGVWLNRASRAQELVLLPRGGGTFSLEVPALSAPGPDAQVPLLVLGGEVFLPVLRAGLGVEAWRAPQGATIRSADEGVVFAAGAGQAFLARRRPR